MYGRTTEVDSECLCQAFMSEVHSTTTINGRRQKDPRGDYVTFSYKTHNHLGRETYVACHGYVEDPGTLEFKEATHAPEKPDSTMKQNEKPDWPDDQDLWDAPDIGYGHTSRKSRTHIQKVTCHLARGRFDSNLLVIYLFVVGEPRIESNRFQPPFHREKPAKEWPLLNVPLNGHHRGLRAGFW
ncbi:hypothetical protein DCS_02038 [Drechmeria coniospora]|uniref:Uncharacterized protein n=1 Tax=Drechmeria coniospora TaxID=98403 RepID=A0A151GUW6_DRECN|nr:hypothetical protein DCS_02038 [Drechmeria coniospora]KYK60899.1 hypothetical protein DCS_02038 [Drechmeria coniospora]